LLKFIPPKTKPTLKRKHKNIAVFFFYQSNSTAPNRPVKKMQRPHSELSMVTIFYTHFNSQSQNHLPHATQDVKMQHPKSALHFPLPNFPNFQWPAISPFF
jgi:hypothetical protein